MVSRLAAIFQRLVGLETEYALRFHPAAADAVRPSRFELFQSVLRALRQRLVTVRARHFKEGVFAANGGAVWFETERMAADGGLLEGATPECRGARQVLTYQRAQDQTLAGAAREAGVPGRLSLIKNCRDSRGHVYGAQENYEGTLATGWRLTAWRAGLVLLAPLVLATWAALLALLLAVLVYLLVAGLLYLPLTLFAPDRRRLGLVLFGRDLVEGRESGAPLAVWLEWLLLWAARFLCAPLALSLLVLVRWFAFHETRRALLPFLVSRALVAGAGTLDDEQRFGLADKAPAVNCLVGYGGYLWDRPMFTFGHFFKALSIEAFLSFREYGDLFRARQRLQIALGDSNMAEVAEFLRVGTTLLVLDAIEAGELREVPRIRRPIRALHRIGADPSLTVSVPLAGGGHMTALQLQWHYVHLCQRFLERHPEAPAEAWEVLDLWGRTLGALQYDRASLVGTVDWVTKQFLLEAAAPDLSWVERKKIDIRYHELSDEGYFQRLLRTGLCPAVVDAQQVARAVRAAPPDSPATTRGHYIREFAGGDEPVCANWKRVVIGRGRRAHVIQLRRYRPNLSGRDTVSENVPPEF